MGCGFGYEEMMGSHMENPFEAEVMYACLHIYTDLFV